MEKTKLVLVPGLLCDAQLWRAQTERLADVADMWVADHTRSNTMAGVARDVLQDAPFEHFALAGLSMGGYISLEIMRQAPQRVRKLALLDTAARGESPEQSARRRDFISLAERGKFLGVTEALLPLPASIKCPTLVLCGRQDQLTPLDRHEEMAAGIKGARLEIIEDCGHMSTMEKPDEVNQALRRWLANQK